MRLSRLSATAALIAILTTIATADASLAKRHHRAVRKHNDIVSVANRSGKCKNLMTGLKSTGLNHTLSGKGPFTVFAPSDSAFAKLPKDNREALLKDEKQLPNILKYHVVKGKMSKADLEQKRAVTTVEGESLMVNTKDGTVLVDGALITEPDIACSNGVIHIIDEVLVPARGK